MTTNEGGLASVDYTPSKGGVYRIQAKGQDKAGHSISASGYQWVASEQYVSWRQNDNDRIALVANQKSYHPGDTAEILIPSPFAKPVTARGAGRSYNDAALNGGGILLDMSGLNQFLEWNPASGQIRCEPGVTLEQLWKKVLPDGWWPPVVSGTMTTTLGGCLGVNIHGKNNFRMGPIGEHVLEFTALLPTGAEITCTPKKNGDLFRAMISGLGMLGVFTSVKLKIKRQGLVGTNPFITHGALRLDIRKPFFGSANTLEFADFQAAATKLNAGVFSSTPVSGGSAYQALLPSTSFQYINKAGLTQIRLRFTLDDNNDLGADNMRFFSGNYTVVSDRPELEVQYTP